MNRFIINTNEIDKDIKSNPSKIKIINIFTKFLEDFKNYKNYNLYCEDLHFNELNDIIEDFLSKKGWDKLKNSRKMMDAFTIVVSNYDRKYSEQENEYLKKEIRII